MKVSTQLGNLSGNQLLLLLIPGSFELFSVDPVEVLFVIFVRPRTKIKIFIK